MFFAPAVVSVGTWKFICDGDEYQSGTCCVPIHRLVPDNCNGSGIDPGAVDAVELKRCPNKEAIDPGEGGPEKLAAFTRAVSEGAPSWLPVKFSSCLPFSVYCPIDSPPLPIRVTALPLRLK
jgi:hypothetical protein